jgi:tetratricopeptide (TPR) repeat protein
MKRISMIVAGAILSVAIAFMVCSGPEDKKVDYVKAGEVLMVQGDVQGALELIQNAVLVDPNYAEAHRLLGELSLAKGDESFALQCFSRALSLDPESPKSRQALARLLGARTPLPAASGSTADSLQKTSHWVPMQKDSALELAIIGQIPKSLSPLLWLTGAGLIGLITLRRPSRGNYKRF